MARVGVAVGAALLWMTTLCPATPARAQVCACPGCCQPPADEGNFESGPSEHELHAVMAGGATAAVAAYVLGVFAARAQTHESAAVDGIPIAGAVASAARNAPDDRNTPLLLFSAGVQAMGLLVIAAAATDLAALHRWSVDVGAGPGGCGVRLTWRLP
ncbi:MAG: hypothetical protein LC659_10955 [Myxococcales bacterium]|nr:hypothetical protein [Myxococcales bacterium]